MKLRIRCSFSELCFYIFWFCLQLGKGFGYVSEDREFLHLLLLGAPFAFVKLFLTKWTAKELLTAAALAVLGIANAVSSGVTSFLLAIFCIAVVKDIDIKKALKVNLFVRGPLFLVRTSMAILGYADMQSRNWYENGVVTKIRYALGYGHPNTAQFELFMLIALFFWIYDSKRKWQYYVIAACYSYFIYSYVGSKTSGAITIVFLICAVIMSRKEERILTRFLQTWSNKCWVIGTMIALVGCMAYIRVPAFRTFGTFSSRFLTATSIMAQNSLSLFGTKDIVTDLGYVYVIYCGGMVYSLLFIMSTYYLLSLKKIEHIHYLQLIFVCLSIHNLMEGYAYSILSNGFLLYLVYVVFPRSYRKRFNNPEREDNNRYAKV